MQLWFSQILQSFCIIIVRSQLNQFHKNFKTFFNQKSYKKYWTIMLWLTKKQSKYANLIIVKVIIWFVLGVERKTSPFAFHTEFDECVFEVARGYVADNIHLRRTEYMLRRFIEVVTCIYKYIARPNSSRALLDGTYRITNTTTSSFNNNTFFCLHETTHVCIPACPT